MQVAIAVNIDAGDPGTTESFDDYTDNMVDVMPQAQELPTDRQRAAADLKRDVDARIIQTNVAAFPANAAAELSRRLHQPGANAASIHKYLLDSGVDIAEITRRITQDYPAE